MSDRLTPLECAVDKLTESVDRLDENQKRMDTRIDQLSEKHHTLDTKQQVSMAQLTIVIGVFIFIATTVAGLVIKSGYDGLRAAIVQQQQQQQQNKP